MKVRKIRQIIIWMTYDCGRKMNKPRLRTVAVAVVVVEADVGAVVSTILLVLTPYTPVYGGWKVGQSLRAHPNHSASYATLTYPAAKQHYHDKNDQNI